MTDDLDGRFADARQILSQDGFALEWDVDDARGVHARVVATDDACTDCLVPRPVLESVIGGALAGSDHHLSALTLPNES